MIQLKNYPVIIEQDGNGCVVSCPMFKGCYSQGKTIDEALKNIKEAIELCIDEEENPIGETQGDGDTRGRRNCVVFRLALV